MGQAKDERIMVFMTCAGAQEARDIAASLVELKKAACVHILPRGESYYRWKGKVEKEAEMLLIAKTRHSLLDGLIREVKSLHSYEVPEIIAVPIADGSAEYMRWMDECLNDGGA